MKLDPAQLKAEADAKELRLQSPLWKPEAVGPDGDWTVGLTRGEVLDDGRTRAVELRSGWKDDEEISSPAPPLAMPIELDTIHAQLDELGSMLGRLHEAVVHLPTRASPREDVSTWLQTAAGDPHAYDGPDPGRMTVCVRVLPTTYARLQQAQARTGLRTLAGAWEWLLRIGLAAVETR